jgi:hypothetical protein
MVATIASSRVDEMLQVPARDDHVVLGDDYRWIVAFIVWHPSMRMAYVYVRPAWTG